MAHTSQSAGIFLGPNVTLEEISIPDGNQVINVNDADKIIGFTLISSLHLISPNMGVMSGTWMVGADRSTISCYMQVIEDPYMKIITCSCQINNGNNTFVISNKSARYWKITQSLPQSTLSRDSNNYKLTKLVLIRKI